MTKNEAKEAVLILLDRAEKLIPATSEKDLPPMDIAPGVPQWHDYEHKIWQIGEEIRQILNTHKTLRKDKELLARFLSVALNRNAKRGRQSFIMLLWYKHCAEYAGLLAAQLEDRSVKGHIIEGLNKMKAGQFTSLVEPFTQDKTTWIRNQAKKYIREFGQTPEE